MGVVIAMNDIIISARDAIKYSTFKVEAYQAPLYGVLGTIRNGQVSYCYRPTRRHTTTSHFKGKKLDLPYVEILYMYEGCSDAMFEAALKAGCKGIVTAGTGNGGTTMSMMKLYRDEAEKGVTDSKLPILVRSSRVPTGGVSEAYRVPGSRIISAGDLNPQKAYMLLRFALAVTDDPEEIRAIFKEY